MKVRTLARLLELANSWADGEDSVRNETETFAARSEHDYDYNRDRGADRRRKRPRRNFTTTEDPTWSPPASRTIGTAGDATIADHQTEKPQKTNHSRRNASGGQDNHAMALERSDQQRNSSTDHEPYMDSKMSEERSDHPTSSGIAEASTS